MQRMSHQIINSQLFLQYILGFYNTRYYETTSSQWTVMLSWLQTCRFTPTFFGRRFWSIK